MNKISRANGLSYLLAFLFLLLGIAWIWWVVVSLQPAVPGLIDDGSHISIGRSYATEGFFHALVRSFESFLHGSRFYDTQFALLGIFHIFFGENLTLWYAGNIFLAMLSASAIGYVIYAETRNPWATLLGGAFLLTSSPVAEALRGNFGKAEAIMVAFIAAGFALWAYSGRSRYPHLCMIGAGVLFILGCVSKESGKVVAIALCLPWIAALVPLPSGTQSQEQKKGASFLWLFFFGVCGILACYLVSLPSRKFQYLQKYFKLDFSLSHIKEVLLVYIQECPDFLIFLTLLAFLYIALLWIYRNRDRRVLLGAACLAGALAYFFGLLGFRFNLPYYLFVPLVLVALSAGLGIAAIPQKRKGLLCAMFAVFFLSRLYSVPYLFMISRAQQFFDAVNCRAMLKGKATPTKAIYAIDIDEECQMIQEWNILRSNFTSTKNAPFIYGAASGFKAWRYQDVMRNRPDIEVEDRSGKMIEAVSSEWRLQVPQPGDMITCRFGKVKVGNHYLRVVMPFSQDENALLHLIDVKSLAEKDGFSQNAIFWNPTLLKHVKTTYGWNFYKVVRPLGYILQGVTADQWMTRDSSVLIPEKSIYLKLEIELDVPQGNSFPFRVWAESDGTEIAEIPIDSPGIKKFAVPVHKNEIVRFHSSSWFQPSKAGLGKDTRELSVRLMKIDPEEESN
ncbi:MAG: hypothetical protein ACFUZC_08175 [Chthoniobacteraceae bacterium]